MFIVHQLYKKYLPVFYRMAGNAGQLLLVATSDEADLLVPEMKTARTTVMPSKASYSLTAERKKTAAVKVKEP